MMAHALEPGTMGEVNVKKVSAGTWIARCKFRDLSGKLYYRQRSGSTAKEAKERLSRITGGVATVSDALDAFSLILDEEVKAGIVSDTTASRYRYCFPRIQQDIGHLHVDKLTRSTITRFFNRLGATMKESTRRQYRTVLKRALQPYVDDGELPYSPVPEIRRSRERKKAPRALTRQEVRRLREYCVTDPKAQRRELGDLVDFMLYTGCRLGEALAVRWQDVNTLDSAQPIVEFTGNIVEVTGKGVVRHAGKTESSVREVTATPTVVAILKRRLTAAGLRAQLHPSDPVFAAVSRSEGVYTWRRPSVVQGWIREAREASDLGWMTSHTWRKTAATMMHDAGLPDREIADVTGHTNLSTLTDVYIGRGSDTDNAMAALELAYEETAK